MIKKEVRLGELITIGVLIVAVLGGWFRLQAQVSANTATIDGTLRLLEKLQDDVQENRDYRIRDEARSQ